MDKKGVENKNEKKKELKKYQKYLKKIVIGIVLATVGIFIAGGPISDFLVKLPFLDDEWAVFLSIVLKVGLFSFGNAKAIINAIKARKCSKKIDNLEDEEQELIEYLEQELEKTKKQNKELAKDKEKTETKKKTSGLKKEKDNSSIANLNNKIEEEYEYLDEPKHKVKR